MQPLFEHRLELAGHRTRVLELEGDGPPVLFLHGFADSADTWRLTLDRLARVERAAVAIDLPGFGHASGLDRGQPVLPQLDGFVAALIEHIAEEHRGEVILAGNSLGGCLTLRAAQRRDLPVTRIVPVAPAGLGITRWAHVVERDPFIFALLRAPFPLPEVAVRALVGNAFKTLAFARPTTVDRHVIRAFTAHHRSRDSVADILAIAHRMLPELKDPFELEQIACPVLLVWGTRDRLLNHALAELVSTAIPTATVELIHGCGHCPQIEEVDRFAQLLVAFASESQAEAA
jgi:pimeloyl-ACP methyl ester carboxylesterase